MLMLKPSEVRTYDELKDIPIPDTKIIFESGRILERTNVWKGIQHCELVDELKFYLEDNNIEITKEKYGVSKDGYDLFGDFQIRLPEMQPFGEYEYEVGFRHSNASRFALSLITGANVSICSNGVAFGFYALRRKHTNQIELNFELTEGILNIKNQIFKGEEFINNLQSSFYNSNIKNYIILELARQNVLAWSNLKKVDNEINCPTYFDFKLNNLYSLYNCVNQIIKEKNATEQHIKLLKLKPIFEEAVKMCD